MTNPRNPRPDGNDTTSVTHYNTLKEGCIQFCSGIGHKFYSRNTCSFVLCSDLLCTDHRFPLPLRGLRPRMPCIDGSNPCCPFRGILECLHFWFFYLLHWRRPVISLLHKENRLLGAFRSECGKICSMAFGHASSLCIHPCYSLSTHFLLCSIQSRKAPG